MHWQKANVEMIVQILGTRGEIESHAPKHSKHSGILVDNKFLIDIGEPEYLNYDPEFILITHWHPDHAYFTRVKKKIKFDVPVYAPELLNNFDQIQIAIEPFIKNGYAITPVPTIHSLKLESQGYIIAKNGKEFFILATWLRFKKNFIAFFTNLT